jgi:hypothetical protein
MNFFETVQEPVNTGGVYIKPGVNDNLVFAGFSVKIDKNGNPMLVRNFYPQGADPEKTTRSQYESFNSGTRAVRVGQKTEDKSNYVIWAESILHFLDAMIKRTDSSKVMFNTLPVPSSNIDDLVPTEEQLNSFVETINPLVTGKVVRYKFRGEEKESTKEAGKIIIVPTLQVAFVPYAEAMEPNAEKAVLPETKLKYNPDSKWDLKRMTVAAPDLDDTFGNSSADAGF